MTVRVVDRNKETGEEVVKIPNGEYIVRKTEGSIIKVLHTDLTLTEAREKAGIKINPPSKLTKPKKEHQAEQEAARRARKK